MTLRAAAYSDIGCHRVLNEDRYAMAPDLGLFLIADGVGGHCSGQTASRLAAVSAIEAVTSAQATATEPAETLRQAVALAHSRIGQAAQDKADLCGMGTTLVMVLVTPGRRLALAHVGDSRAYLVRRGEIRRLTEDHSWVGELLKRRQITEADAVRHPQRHVLTKALGMPGTVLPDLMELTLQPSDRILLCSDGLTGALSDEEILVPILGSPRPETACDQLVRSAMEKGGDDNITALLLYG